LCLNEFEDVGHPRREEATGKPFAGGFVAIGMRPFRLYLLEKPLTARIWILPEAY
jgi:hypothetical protein